MYRKLIINESDHENRVALLEDGNIVELFIERGDETDIAGNIYKGRVQRVLPGIQAAFIDLGLQQAAFIYVGDLIDYRSQTLEDVIDQGQTAGVADEEDDRVESPGFADQREAKIEEILSEDGIKTRNRPPILPCPDDSWFLCHPRTISVFHGESKIRMNAAV